MGDRKENVMAGGRSFWANVHVDVLLVKLHGPLVDIKLIVSPYSDRTSSYQISS